MSKTRSQEFLNFFFHFSRDAISTPAVNFSYLIEARRILLKKLKDVVEYLHYCIETSSSLVAPNVGNSLSGRGITNPFNNCWANSVLQALHGSSASQYLPSTRKCLAPVWKYLTNIQFTLQCTSVTFSKQRSLPVTPDMHNLISKMYNRDQKFQCVQDDAADFLQMISKSLPEHCEEGAFHFKSKTIHISGCSKCKKIVHSISEDFCLHLAITTQTSDNISVQSLLWEWYINSDVQNTVT